MTDEQPKGKNTAQPTGKRQLSGASTTSTSSYETKKVARPDTHGDDKPGGGATAFPSEVVTEMRKVVWPTGRQMLNYTMIVFAFLIIMTAIVWGVDTLTVMGVEWILVP